MRKRLLSLVLALCMMLSLVPMTALAEGESGTTPTVEAGKAVLASTNVQYDTLREAISNAATEDTIYLGNGVFYSCNENTGTSQVNEKIASGKTLTIIGSGAENTTWNVVTPDSDKSGEGNSDYSLSGANKVTFKNMTLNMGVKWSDITKSNPSLQNRDYQGLCHIEGNGGETVVEDCVINGTNTYWGYSSSVFKNVTFNNPTLRGYATQVYTGTSTTFDNCVFNATSSGRFIHLYREAAGLTITVNVNSCTFNGASFLGNVYGKSAVNIKDSMDNYNVSFTGKNVTNTVVVDSSTCSRLFMVERVGEGTYNTTVTMGGTTVWQNGKMVDADAVHLTGVTPTDGSYTNGVEGAESSWYAEGHKDHKVTTTYTDWEKQDDGSYTRTATTKCGYCGWSKEETQTGYQVTYNLNEGTGAEGVTYDAETVVSGETATAKAAPTKEGYTFAGWKVDETTTYQPDAEITVTGNITLTAQWAPNAYTVSFDSNGGTAVDSQTVNYNEKATEPTAPTKEATAQYTYTFNGWMLNGNAYNFDTPVTGDIELVANWKETTNQYTLTYNTNGGTDVASVTVDYGAEVEVNGTTAKEGYKFLGWYMDEGLTQKADEKITLTGNVTVYAKWDNTPDLEKGDHYAYIIGYEDQTVRPENNITRAEVATIFYRLLTDEARDANKATTNSFTDVNAGDWYNTAISTLANMNIINGYKDGTFKPNEPITRAELATIAARFSLSEPTGEISFSDVSTDHWAYKFIAKAAALGWVKGDAAEEGKTTTFRPEDNIKRDEVMTLVNRVLERAVDQAGVEKNNVSMSTWTDNADTSAWYYYDVQEATNSHKYERSDRSVKGQTYAYENWTEITENRDWAALEKE